MSYKTQLYLTTQEVVTIDMSLNVFVMKLEEEVEKFIKVDAVGIGEIYININNILTFREVEENDK